MSQLKLIIKREYLNDVTSRSFWIGTILFPILMVGFGVFIGFLSAESDTMQEISTLGQEHDDITGQQLMAMIMGMFLTIFLMVYGSQIFNKVKTEKTSRIMEIIATCTTGRTMMLGKVIAVALIGLTQLLVWFGLIIVLLVMLVSMLDLPALLDIMLDGRVWLGMLYAMIYFVGGYMIFGSLYAMVGAMTDRDNENQGYIVIITFLLLASFYIAQFTIDNPDSAITLWCAFIPFTSPSIGATAAISGTLSFWQIALSIIILYATAWFCISLAGKIYTSAMLLSGKKLTPTDIMTFIRAK